MGKRIQIMRRQRGVTQDDVAEALGISFQQLQRIEHGTTPISATMLIRLAGTLGCGPEKLLPQFHEPEVERATHRTAPDRQLQIDVTEMIRVFVAIPNHEDRRRILSLATSLANGVP